jgi:ABC-type polysaccharide/polyol phosphate transport system ATPase subunit
MINLSKVGNLNCEVIINGKIASLLELGTGFNPDMTGHENIYLYGTLMGRSREEIDSTVNDILEFADIYLLCIFQSQ